MNGCETIRKRTENWKILKRKMLHNYPFSGNTIPKTNKKVDGVK